MTISRRRIYVLPTRFGLAFGLLLVAMLIAGLNYNSNLGLAFGFLMTSLVLVTMHHCHRNLQGLGVDAVLDYDAFADGTADIGVVLHNTAYLARCDIEVRCGDARVSHSVAPASFERAVVSVALRRRGILRIDQVELRTGYPFGWFRAWTYVHIALTVYVAPAPRGERALPPANSARGDASNSEARGDDDFAGLRAYEPGVPIKHMAWKVLARGGEPAVRSYTGLAARPEWLDWATLPELDLERRLSQLCRWVLDSEAAGHDYGLRIPGVEIAPSRGAAHRTACLRALAACTGEPGP